MTYQQLFDYLKTLSKEDLEKNVTVFDSHFEEFMPVSSVKVTAEDYILDAGHPFLEI